VEAGFQTGIKPLPVWTISSVTQPLVEAGFLTAATTMA